MLSSLNKDFLTYHADTKPCKEFYVRYMLCEHAITSPLHYKTCLKIPEQA